MLPVGPFLVQRLFPARDAWVVRLFMTGPSPPVGHSIPYRHRRRQEERPFWTLPKKVFPTDRYGQPIPRREKGAGPSALPGLPFGIRGARSGNSDIRRYNL